MGLEQQLNAFQAEFARPAPGGRAALYQDKLDELRASFASQKAIGVGDRAPAVGVLALGLGVRRSVLTARCPRRRRTL